MAKLGWPPALRTFLVITNAIENFMGGERRVSRNVTRWRAGGMASLILRLTAVAEASNHSPMSMVSVSEPAAPSRAAGCGRWRVAGA